MNPVKLLICQVPNARHEGIAQQIAQPKGVLNVPMRVSGMLSQAQDGVVFQQAVQDIEGLARRAGDDPGAKNAELA